MKKKNHPVKVKSEKSARGPSGCGALFLAAATLMTFPGCAEFSTIESPQKAANGQSTLVWEARSALAHLTSTSDVALSLANESKGVLVFPFVSKSGLFVEEFHGKGVLLRNGEVTGFYKTQSAVSG